MAETSTAHFFAIPEYCPVCAGRVDVQENFLYCASSSCPAKLSGAVKVWVRNLGLLHWGESLIDSLTDPSNPRIGSVADLYRLDISDLSECCSGEKMAKKLHGVLHSNKEMPLELMLASLNIPNFGNSTATDLVQAGFDTVEKVLSVGFEELRAVPNIGEKTAKSIQEGLLLKRDIILDLSAVLTIKKPAGGALQGKTVCITGELSRPRKMVEKDVMDAGGFPKGSVSKTTSYLVTNQPDTASSKMQNAKKHGVPVIDETGLYDLIRGTSHAVSSAS